LSRLCFFFECFALVLSHITQKEDGWRNQIRKECQANNAYFWSNVALLWYNRMVEFIKSIQLGNGIRFYQYEF